MKLYNSTISGNCYKIRLLLAHLGVDYEKVEVDVTAAERPAELLEHSPAGLVPMLLLDDGKALSESDAILWHLARGTDYLPEGADEQTEVLRWLFFEQNAHEPNIAVARFIEQWSGRADELVDVLEYKRVRGHRALAAMDRHLKQHDFFACGRYTIADIALYGYTHVADEGGFELTGYPALGAWMERVRSQPGHVTMFEALPAT